MAATPDERDEGESQRETEPVGDDTAPSPAVVPGALYVVSTPIGNLGDITHRALAILGGVTRIVAEDTRHSRSLLDRYRIRTPTTAYHEHNEARETPRLVAAMKSGDSIALITDAGTPLLSDPGMRLVQGAIDAAIPVVPVPGASALLAALVGSGLATDRFTFFGFLARRGGERRRAIEEVVALPHAAVLYESPQRIGTALSELATAGAGDRIAVVARELTKRFETFERGTVSELAARFEDGARGEIVLVVAGATPHAHDDAAAATLAARLRADGVSSRDVSRRLVEELGTPRNLAYRLAHDADASADG